MAINIESAEQANALDIQNQYNFRSQLQNQLSGPDALRNQRKMDNLKLSGASDLVDRGNGGVTNWLDTNGTIGGSINYSGPITSASLSGSETPINLSNPSPSTIADSISGRSTALLEQDALEQKAAQETADRQAKLDETVSKQQSLLERIGLVKKEETEKGNEEFGLDTLKTDRRQALQDIKTYQVQELSEIKGLDSMPLTTWEKSQKVSEIKSRYGLKQLESQLTYYLANDNITAAEETINDRITLATEPLYAQLDLTKDVYSQISASLSKSEDREWQLAISDREQKIKQVEDLEKYKGNIAITYSQNNGKPLPSYVQAKINRAESIEEVNQILSDQGISLAKPVSSGGNGGSFGGTEYASDLDAIIGATLSTIPTKFGQQTFQDQIGRARDDADRINLVAAQVLKGQPAEFKNDFRNQAVGIGMIDKAIAELDKGTQTGVLQAGKQYAANFLGKDYDPALAKIEGYITSAIQPYRNSVTGAAWGEQEDQEYASLFGSTKYNPAALRQRLLQTKELLKSKSAEGLNAFVNPLGTYDNQFQTGNLAPNQSQNPEDIWNEVVGGKAESSSWIGNLWNSLFN